MNKFREQFMAGAGATMLVLFVCWFIWGCFHLVKSKPKETNKTLIQKVTAPTPTPSLVVKKKWGPFEFEYSKK